VFRGVFPTVFHFPFTHRSPYRGQLANDDATGSGHRAAWDECFLLFNFRPGSCADLAVAGSTTHCVPEGGLFEALWT